METEKIPIAELKQDPRNVNEHNETSIRAIMASLAEFGQQKPIVIDQDNVVRSGNGTYIAAMRLCWQEISCYRSQLSAEALERYAIADNRTAQHSQFNENKLAAEIARMEREARERFAESDAEDIEERLRKYLDSTGFDVKERAELLAKQNVVPPSANPSDSSEGNGNEDAKPEDGDVKYSVIIPCSSEKSQIETYNALVEAGYKARKAST